MTFFHDLESSGRWATARFKVTTFDYASERPPKPAPRPSRCQPSAFGKSLPVNGLWSIRKTLCYSTIFGHRRQGANRCRVLDCCWRRHAETSAPDRFHGAESDIGLSEFGARQAERLAEYLSTSGAGGRL